MLTECVVDADGPGHALLTLDGGEHFGGVLESDRSFSHGVGDGKDVDESNAKNKSEIRHLKNQKRRDILR